MKNFRNQFDYQKKELIDNGSSGLIYKIFNTKEKNYYIMKQILLKKIDDIKRVENEAIILKNITHDNFVKYYDSFKDNNSFYIIMEYCDNSNLKKFINLHKKNKELIEEKVLYFIILDICKGLKEIHDNHIIHRDLKPENLFIGKDYKIKIGDFGISKKLIDTKHANTNNIGTSYYMAPELLNQEKYDNKIDIWALGCIIYELFTLNLCFENECNFLGLINKINNCIYNKIDLKKYNSEWQNLIDSLLKKNKEERFDINLVCNYISKLKGKYSNKIINMNSLDKISYNI